MNDNDTQLKKSLDEDLRTRLVIDLIELADKYLISERYKEAYLTLKALYIKIRPYKFAHKDDLEELKRLLDEYIESIGERPVDGHHQIKIAENQLQFKEVLYMFYEHIPFALNDLKLYFDISESNLDDDGHFFSRHFNLDKTLIEDKKEELCQLDIKEVLGHMDAKMVNRVYSRYRIASSMKETYPK